MSSYFYRAICGAALLAASVLCLSACLTQTVASQCEAVVDKQCEACFACAESDDMATGTDICGLIEATSEADCREELQSQCEQQSRLLRDPYDELDNCESSLDRVTCEQRLSWYSLDQDRSPETCGPFLY
ncbi:MAG: hypothetical protein ACQEVA_14040 [Myxococcota bacterium]